MRSSTYPAGGGVCQGRQPEYWQERQKGADRIGTYDQRIRQLEERVERTLGLRAGGGAAQFRR